MTLNVKKARFRAVPSWQVTGEGWQEPRFWYGMCGIQGHRNHDESGGPDAPA
jgi:hypothetical protein